MKCFLSLFKCIFQAPRGVCGQLEISRESILLLCVCTWWPGATTNIFQEFPISLLFGNRSHSFSRERCVIKTRSRGKTLQECETVLSSQVSIHHSVLGLVMQLLYWLLICPMGGDTCVGEFLLMRTSMITMMTTVTLQTMNLSPLLPPGSHLSPQVGGELRRSKFSTQSCRFIFLEFCHRNDKDSSYTTCISCVFALCVVFVVIVWQFWQFSETE